ncbi:DNA repair protein RadA [candidate division WWE3 bacterium RIFCSPHIGHO2_01_FULL_40_23]|uniref:DNA repair protein RadA n=1 Tax=candidate division WWE3 bacterium RIFCSPLOWO2_01_FULL_41_18 TaxID=1802625 RepID=A0A1F4VEX7_UNCKA|nr:MAG: DNA repair protein RadA [candidate division WWE3 bacterium RIFCSPHIGHO2_01_FULL_40_23]OGC55714.1 MAG: DNA repair protein RadA [candidate division WWE3 bacterium RIFCSPLOWO2_01_FULL_41_18]
MPQKTTFVCQNCSFESPKWVGQCPRCSKWNTFVETLVAPVSSRKYSVKVPPKASSIKKLSEVSIKADSRVSSGIGEFDRVLGGGFVPGQVVLLAGEPGIGKSTLLIQIADKLKVKDKEVLYISGEESPQQIKLRADRLSIKGTHLTMLSETNVDSITEFLKGPSPARDLPGPALVIVDSIQTLTTAELTGTAGSVGQVRESALRLSNTAKEFGIPMVLVGHITKEGSIAGPKVLEHLVDTVLYIEGDEQHLFRLLRTSKNRFGPVSEVGIFEMGEAGMTEVKNPSDLFLEERMKSAPGSCVTVVMEGYRPILFEVQALTTPTSFGYPKRTASGFNVNRLSVLVAVLEKRCGLKLSNEDVYVNVAGGMKIIENSCDLAICLAIYSSLTGKPLNTKAVVFGEVGLSGEVRKVPFMQNRVKEAKKLGFTKIISPLEVKSVNGALKLV